MRSLIYTLVIFVVAMGSHAQTTAGQKKFWKAIESEIPEFKEVFKKYKKYRFEIIYGQVNHEPGKPPRIHKYYFGDNNSYFYPASLVKLPTALRAFQYLNTVSTEKDQDEMQWSIVPTGNKLCGGYTPTYAVQKYLRVSRPMSVRNAAASCGMQTEAFMHLNNLGPFDTVSPGDYILASSGAEKYSVNEMVSEMLVYSNNMFYNLLFDLAGGETCQAEKDVKIVTRFMPCPGNEARYNSFPLKLKNDKTGYIYDKPAEKITGFDKKIFSEGLAVGKATMVDSVHKTGPKHFESHNAIRLETMLNYIIELVYPGYLPEGSFYNISAQQRKFLIRYLGMRPGEDKIVSDTAYLRTPDDYTNYLYTGQKHEPLPANIRIVNIVGQSFGFITDCMYFADEAAKVDFFLAARIYVNEDGIVNDDKYEYDEIAFPLFEQLGKKIYEYEKKRTNKTYTSNPGWLFEIFR